MATRIGSFDCRSASFEVISDQVNPNHKQYAILHLKYGIWRMAIGIAYLCYRLLSGIISLIDTRRPGEDSILTLPSTWSARRSIFSRPCPLVEDDGSTPVAEKPRPSSRISPQS